MLRFTRRETRFASLASIVLTAFVMSGCPGPHCTSDQVEIEGACYSICDDGTAVCNPDGGHADVRFDLGVMEASTDAGDIVDTIDSPDVVDVVDVVDVPDVPTCGAGEAMCGDHCVSTQTSPENCGACNRVCPGVVHGTATCAAGVCDFTCATGFHACGGVCSDDTSPLSCGTSCMPCPAPPGASPSCTAGACGWACDPGYDMVGSTCELRVPRQIAPLSGSTTTSQQPTFHWELATGTDGATVEVCADRAFTMSCQSLNATGTSIAPLSPLTRGTWFWRVHGRIGGTTGMRTGPVWEFMVGSRSAPTDTSWGSTLDVNGDGFADVAVSASGAMSSTGRVYVYLGSSTGIGTAPSAMLTGADGTGGYFGQSVASAGDVNGDGFGDLLVGAEGAHRAYVYLGSSAGLRTAPAVVLDGPDRGYFGHSVAAAGDTDGDGYADVVIGAYGPDLNTGRAYVYRGSASGLASTPSTTLVGPDGAGGNFGWSVAGAGDVDADGFADIAVGAYGANTSTGRAYVYRGGSSGIGTTADTTLTGPAGTNARFGTSIGGADDLNGDGFADLIVGADRASGSAGRAYVYSGGASGLVTTPTTLVGPDIAGSLFGSSVASAGDVNGDGFADAVIGAPGVSTSTGRAYVYGGSASGVGSAPTATLTGPDGTGGSFGTSVSGGGDVDGDQYSDLVVGAVGVGSAAGRAYIYRGSGAGLIVPPSTSLQGADGAGGNFGRSVALTPRRHRGRQA